MNIEKFCEIYELGTVINISKITGGLMHKMFKVETTKDVYCIKLLNPEVMNRKEAYDNFVISENISNLAKDNNIPVSNALKINGNYLNKLDDFYYMVFKYIDGKVLKDREITVDHCKKIGHLLAHIHLLNYESIGLKVEQNHVNDEYDWKDYINNPNFSLMSYSYLYLGNYKKYYSLLKRVNERYNDSNNKYAICHRDLDPKNVMWKDNNPIVIDWESSCVDNPFRELFEVALNWSGFLSDNFRKEKFKAVFEEYSTIIKLENVKWYSIICGNLKGRFDWLKYNLDRSLGIITSDYSEQKLGEKEAHSTIHEINRYIDLIGEFHDIISRLVIKEENNYENIINKIVESNKLLEEKSYYKIPAGFTNTIYSFDKYIVRICTNIDNEKKFENEINFYKENNNIEGIPKMYYYDISKSVVPYYYEIIERIRGNTLYDIWYRLNNEEKESIVKKIVNIVKQLHLIKVNSYNFEETMKSKVTELSNKCKLDENIYKELINIASTYFKDNVFGLIHGDLHFDNFIYDGKNLFLIDFERCMPGPIDYDFRIFARYDKEPYLWASIDTDMLTVDCDYQDFLQMLFDNYKELREVPNIDKRLDFYRILELLDNYKNTKNKERLYEVINLIEKIKR